MTPAWLMDVEMLAARVHEGSPRALARALSWVENEHAEAERLVDLLYPHAGSAHVIGVTGPPGAGKSSLIDALVAHLRRRGRRVGVIAVDPTSPYSGGAILGDRIRMVRHATDSDVFIRSMATRDHPGGLAGATHDAVHLLAAAGFETVVVETVGVGQSEVEVAELADTTLLVLIPGAGDEVQILKAGIMEIADVFVLNKADREGIERLRAEVRELVARAEVPEGGWRPPVLQTVAVREEGVPELLEAVAQHGRHLEQTGLGRERRRRTLRLTLHYLVARRLSRRILRDAGGSGLLEELVEGLMARRLSPYQAVARLMALLAKGA